MTYDDFHQKLLEIKASYLKTNGKSLETIQELEALLNRRLAIPKKRGLKSVRGLF